MMVILTLLVMTGCSRGPEGNELPSKQLVGDGLIALKKDGKWGYLNTKGDEVIPIEYDNAGIFQHGLSVVVKEDEHFLLNAKGQQVIEGPSEFLKVDVETGLIWFVEDGKVYVVTNRCEVMCLDAAGFHDGQNNGPYTDEVDNEELDADIIWSFDMIEELGVFPHNLATSSPVVYGDLLLLVTSNGVDEAHLEVPSPRAPSFVALNKNTGEVVWEDSSPGIDSRARRTGTTPPRSRLPDGRLDSPISILPIDI